MHWWLSRLLPHGIACHIAHLFSQSFWCCSQRHAYTITGQSAGLFSSIRRQLSWWLHCRITRQIVCVFSYTHWRLFQRLAHQIPGLLSVSILTLVNSFHSSSLIRLHVWLRLSFITLVEGFPGSWLVRLLVGSHVYFLRLTDGLPWGLLVGLLVGFHVSFHTLLDRVLIVACWSHYSLDCISVLFYSSMALTATRKVDYLLNGSSIFLNLYPTFPEVCIFDFWLDGMSLFLHSIQGFGAVFLSDYLSNCLSLFLHPSTAFLAQYAWDCSSHLGSHCFYYFTALVAAHFWDSSMDCTFLFLYSSTAFVAAC